MTPRRPLPSRAPRAGGFTLVELMIGIAILAILATIAVPSFNQAALSNRLTSYANTFSASLTLARSEAIKRNGCVSVCRSANGTSCATTGTWQQGWIVFADNSPGTPANRCNGALDTDETRIAQEQALSSDYDMTSGGGTYALTFQGTGMSGTSQVLTLCRATPEPGSQKRTITIDAVGRPSIARVSNATSCP